AEVFRQDDEPRAFSCRPADQRLRLREIRFHLAAGDRLHRGDAHFRAGAGHRSLVDLGKAAVAGTALVLPLFATMGSDQPPLTVYSKRKIFSTGSCRSACAKS